MVFSFGLLYNLEDVGHVLPKRQLTFDGLQNVIPQTAELYMWYIGRNEKDAYSL
jgi:hypothetical protein